MSTYDKKKSPPIASVRTEEEVEVEAERNIINKKYQEIYQQFVVSSISRSEMSSNNTTIQR